MIPYTGENNYGTSEDSWCLRCNHLESAHYADGCVGNIRIDPLGTVCSCATFLDDVAPRDVHGITTNR